MDRWEWNGAEANGIRSFPCLHGCLNCQRRDSQMSISPFAQYWIVGKLECDSLGACFKPELLSRVCEVDQIPLSDVWKPVTWLALSIWELSSSSSIRFQCSQQGLQKQQQLHLILKSITSVLFHLSWNVLCAHLFFAWIYLFINIHSECHICDSFEKKKNKYCFFNLSQPGDLLALVAIVITIPL